jgi:hypothetical protein
MACEGSADKPDSEKYHTFSQTPNLGEDIERRGSGRGAIGEEEGDQLAVGGLQRVSGINMINIH